MTDQSRRIADATPAANESRIPRAVFAAGLATVAANGALYFFGVDSLSHPVVSVVGVALLVAVYLQRR